MSDEAKRGEQKRRLKSRWGDRERVRRELFPDLGVKERKRKRREHDTNHLHKVRPQQTNSSRVRSLYQGIHSYGPFLRNMLEQGAWEPSALAANGNTDTVCSDKIQTCVLRLPPGQVEHDTVQQGQNGSQHKHKKQVNSMLSQRT